MNYIYIAFYKNDDENEQENFLSAHKTKEGAIQAILKDINVCFAWIEPNIQKIEQDLRNTLECTIDNGIGIEYFIYKQELYN